jgi:hypothetical protein
MWIDSLIMSKCLSEMLTTHESHHSLSQLSLSHIFCEHRKIRTYVGSFEDHPKFYDSFDGASLLSLRDCTEVLALCQKFG